MAGAVKLPLAVIIEAVDKLTGPMRKVQRSLQQTFAPVTQLKNSLVGLGEAAGLPAAGKALGQFKDKAAAALGSIVAFGRKVAIVAAAAGAAIVGLVESFGHAGESILRSSRKLGVGVETLQELRYAAKQYGVEQDELESGLLRMSKGIGEAARGQGKLGEALQRLNIPLRDSKGKLRTVDDLIPEIADHLNELSDDGRRTALTMAIFGRGGAALTPMLRHGSDAIEHMRYEARRLGLVMSEDDVEAAEKFIQAQNRVEGAFTGLKNAAAKELTPALTNLANSLATFLSDPETKKSIQEFMRTIAKELPGAIRDFTNAIKPLMAILKELGDRFGYKNLAIFILLAVVFYELATAILPLVTAFAALVSVLAPVAAALGVGLAPLILIVAAAIVGLLYRIAEFGLIAYQVLRNWQPIKTFFEDLFEFTKRGWDEMVRTITGAVGKITSILPDWLTGKSSTIAVKSGAPIGVSGAGSGSGSSPSRASVLVRFENAPKGTRMVPQGNSGVDLDTSMGYSMIAIGG